MKEGRVKALALCIDNNWNVGDILDSAQWKAPRMIVHIQYRHGKAWVTLLSKGNQPERVLTFPKDTRRIFNSEDTLEDVNY